MNQSHKLELIYSMFQPRRGMFQPRRGMFQHVVACFSHVVACFSHVVACFNHVVACFSHVVACFSHVVACFSHVVACFNHVVACFRYDLAYFSTSWDVSGFQPRRGMFQCRNISSFWPMYRWLCHIALFIVWSLFDHHQVYFIVCLLQLRGNCIKSFIVPWYVLIILCVCKVMFALRSTTYYTYKVSRVRYRCTQSHHNLTH